MFRAERGKDLSGAVSRIMAQKYTRTAYENMKKKLMGCNDSENVCVENSEENAEQFSGSTRFVFDNMASTFKIISSIAYHVHTNVLIVSTK